MNLVKLTDKGQFTLNKPNIEHLGTKFGDRLIVQKSSDRSLRIRAESDAIPLSALHGCIEVSASYSDEDIQNAIVQGYINSGLSGLEKGQ